ncbi:MAG: hypothetical protein DRR16_13885 [Candidatus Parabeggiatoa sp. nov. 3]|nr:MAG: hypothetical protein DRQ99_24300 [Gammaproteobacteria bacterium]RKZ84725.1 MAG: hypothetical protein DRR16_13885 [Gammaproteobacteria bacterium]
MRIWVFVQALTTRYITTRIILLIIKDKIVFVVEIINGAINQNNAKHCKAHKNELSTEAQINRYFSAKGNPISKYTKIYASVLSNLRETQSETRGIASLL